MRVLIAGGGIAGQALAFWLVRGGHEVTVAERSPGLRDTGAQIDLRGEGIEAVARMGLLERVRAARVDEPGVAFVDARGRVRATVLANASGRGRQSLTSEHEIMRGDLVRILHEATRDDEEYVFGRGVEQRGGFDLLVGADGQGSRLRRRVLPPGEDPYRRLGIHLAYWFVPRTVEDGAVRDSYVAPGGRMIMRRSHHPDVTQVYFALREDSDEARRIHREPLARQQRFWAQRFAGAGWQTERFIEGLATTPGFYSQEVVQVHASTWSRDRTVLVGDAAHCASPYSGMGASGALIGAYVLAGEINRAPGDLPGALARYETTLRPFAEAIQAEVKPGLLRLALPESRVAVEALLGGASLAGFLRLPGLVSRLARQDRGGAWKLPDYARVTTPAG